MEITADILEKLSPTQKEKVLNLLREKEEYRKAHKLEYYKPYPKQRAFHALGKEKKERLFTAGNQLGKTWSAAYETAMHVTCSYPDWWEGRTFENLHNGVRMWVCSESMEFSRDNAQKHLLGNIGEWGSGTIPKDRIIDIKRSRGIADAVDTVVVRRKKGDLSKGAHGYILFKSYEKGADKAKGDTVNAIWNDEEPSYEWYVECLARVSATKGMIFTTFTPLKGMSAVVYRFYEDLKDCIVNMSIDDVDHYTEKEKQEIISTYPAHEREARAYGKPRLGSGRVFPVETDSILVDPFPIPDHWPQLIGMDFGWDHPTAGVWLAFDEDVTYITHTYRQGEQTIPIHASALRGRGKFPVAWPHDGLQHDRQSGKQLAQLYRDEGLNMISVHAQYGDDRGWGLEAGIQDMLTRMQTNRFKVFSHLNDWVEEFLIYHRKDGKIVKEREDLMAATRYGVMMERYAEPVRWAHEIQKRYLPHVYQSNSWMSQ